MGPSNRAIKEIELLRSQVAELQQRILSLGGTGEEESVVLLQAVLDSLPSFATLISPDGTLVEANRQALALLGLSRGEVIGQNLADLQCWPQSTGLQQQVREAVKSAAAGQACRFEARTWLGGEQYAHLDVSLTPLLSRDGSVIRIVGSAVDITDRIKAAEERERLVEQIHVQHERLRLAQDAANAGIWDIDLITGQARWSEEFAALNGMDSGTTQTDRHFLVNVHPGDRARVEREIQHAISSGGELNTQYRVERAGETRWLETVGRVVERYEGRAARVSGITLDVTDRKLADQAVRASREIVERTSEELNQFAYAASHDLQEPLRTIVTHSQLLTRRHKDELTEDAEALLHEIEHAALRMRALVLDLLTYSRVVNAPIHESSRADATAALQWTIMNLSASIEETGAKITWDTLPTVHADDSQLVQLFQNLISNSIKYHSEKPPAIHVRVEENGEECLFSVRDNGIGIDPQYHERIFGVFKRLHGKDYPGTGIGLAICAKIVERYGGRIWVESEAGRGADFRFTLKTM